MDNGIYKSKNYFIILEGQWNAVELYWRCRACKLSGLVNNPDSIGNYLINNFFGFFPNQKMVVIHKTHYGIGSFFDTLNQIWIEINGGIIQPGQFDHSGIQEGGRKPFRAAQVLLIVESTLFAAGYSLLHLCREVTLFAANAFHKQQNCSCTQV